MNKFLLPLKREVWENYGSFIKMPALILTILSLLLLVTTIGFGGRLSSAINSHYNFDFSESIPSWTGVNDDARTFDFKDLVVGEAKKATENGLGEHEELRQSLKMSLRTPYILFHGLMILVAFTFLLSCLLADRKDGSILFWKSMPVSETQSVITKLFTAVVLLPAIAWLAAFVMSIVILVNGIIFAWFSDIDHLASTLFAHSTVIETGWEYLGTFLAISLWLLPVAAWSLCASAAAKKNAFLTAILPAILIIVVERYLLGSNYFGRAFFQHLSGLLPSDGAGFMLLQPGWGLVGKVLMSMQFWIAIAVSAALLYASVWYRENRYEN